MNKAVFKLQSGELWVHRIFSNRKVWAFGVYHGLRRKHLQSYLDEFVFRFNRRRTRLLIAGRQMTASSIFFRTRSPRGGPYEQYCFDGERVECERVVPNATLNGAPRTEPVRSWSAEEIISATQIPLPRMRFWMRNNTSCSGAQSLRAATQKRLQKAPSAVQCWGRY